MSDRSGLPFQSRKVCLLLLAALEAMKTKRDLERPLQYLRKGMLGSLHVHTLGSNSTGC